MKVAGVMLRGQAREKVKRTGNRRARIQSAALEITDERA